MEKETDVQKELRITANIAADIFVRASAANAGVGTPQIALEAFKSAHHFVQIKKALEAEATNTKPLDTKDF